MKQRDDQDLFAGVPREDGQRAYGGKDHQFGAGNFGAHADQHPEQQFDTVELGSRRGPGDEFTKAELPR